MQHVLITGATGFLGRALAQYLRNHGVRVLAAGRSDAGCAALRAQGFDVLQHDWAQPFEAPQDLQGIDAIVHCAAFSSPFGRLSLFHQANVVATQNLVDLALQLGVTRFVNIGSPSIYFAFRDQLNVAEDHPLPAPVNHYARTKAQAEAMVLAHPQIGPVNLRPRGIYGVGDTALLPRLTRAAARGPLPRFRGHRARIDLTHVDDVCRAIHAALIPDTALNGHAFNISGGTALLVRDIVEQACGRLGQPVRWRSMPLAPVRVIARTADLICRAMPHQPEPNVTPYALGLFAYEQSLDLSKSARLLHWTPQVSFEDGLARSIPASAA